MLCNCLLVHRFLLVAMSKNKQKKESKLVIVLCVSYVCETVFTFY